MTPQEKNEQLFAKFIGDKKILVADPNSSSRSGIAKMLISLGAKTPNILMVKSFEEAEAQIQANQPAFVITDYNLDRKCGLDLLQQQRNKNEKSVFVLVTGNTSQSAVAQAAEEDVDTFVIKPYTIENFKKQLVSATLARVSPSPYMVLIMEAKKLIADVKADEAIKLLEEAKAMEPKPALACFYLGQAQLLKSMMEDADGSYRNGLNFNKIHYKCLIGLYDILKKNKQHAQAYEIVKKVARYFPANPKRLAEVLHLAIITQSYEDVEKFYQIFKEIDERTDDLIRYICAAMTICGKFYLRQSSNSRAVEVLTNAAIAAAGRTRILREIVIAFMEYGKAKEATVILERFPQDQRNGQDFAICEYAIQTATLEAAEAMNLGQKLIQQGVKDAWLYESTILKALALGNSGVVNSTLEQAILNWPEQKSRFEKLAATAPPETAKNAA